MPEAAGIFYRQTSGGEPQPGRPPLVLIHGAGGHHLFWPPQLRRLEGWEVLAPDLPGHGVSPSSEAATIGAYAERLMDWARALGIARAVWAGHSMGAAIVLTIALRRPALVSGLVLAGASVRLRVDPSLLAGLERSQDYDSTVERILRGFFCRQAPSSLVDAARVSLHKTPPDLLHRDFAACARFDLRSRLGEILAPALVLTGSDDVMTTPDEGRALAAGLSRGEFELIDGAGHMVMLERAEDVEKAVKRFLGELTTNY